MKLGVIILNYNTRDLLVSCLKSILSKKWKTHLTVTVVDNGSKDDSVQVLKKFPQVKLIENGKNLGYAAGNNVALKAVSADYCLLLNSDTEVLENSLDKLVEFAKEGDFGVTSCELINPDKTFQSNAGELPFGLPLFFWISGLDDLPVIGRLFPSFHQKYEANLQKNGSIGWVSGTAMLISKEVIGRVGLLDDRIFMYAEDVDYCVRAKRAGFKIGWTNTAQIKHLSGGSLNEPQYRQWLGEFKGLVYLYKKYFGSFAALGLRLLIYFFTLVRMFIFLVLGRVNSSKTYAKILVSL